jgi:uncharacterized protein
MEDHAGMDMSVTGGPFLRRIASRRGFTAVSHAFVMDWAAIWRDIAAGLLIAGAVAADLIVLPILNIYRKYYGWRMALFLLGTFYATMVAAGLVVEVVFGALGLVPTGPRHAAVIEAHVTWNYTTVLNIVFLTVGAALVWRFFTTGARAMLRMMGRPAGEDDVAGRMQPHRHPEAPAA